MLQRSHGNFIKFKKKGVKKNDSQAIEKVNKQWEMWCDIVIYDINLLNAFKGNLNYRIKLVFPLQHAQKKSFLYENTLPPLYRRSHTILVDGVSRSTQFSSSLTSLALSPDLHCIRRFSLFLIPLYSFVGQQLKDKLKCVDITKLINIPIISQIRFAFIQIL